MTRSEFIKKAKVVHDGENLDYSKVEYVNNRTPVCIIDPEYGEFWQTPSNHLRGQRHPMRKGGRISSSKRMTTEEYISRAKAVHDGENLDYSKTVYNGMHAKIYIIDPVYGEYWQEASAHLKGSVHPLRALRKNADNQRYTTDKFKELCHEIHPDYILDNVEYVSSKTKVKVICPKHGEFLASPDLLLQGKGCPKCGHHYSKGEDELYGFVSSLIGSDNVIKGDRSVLDGMELDVYIPSLGVAFEFDGLRWHSEMFGKTASYHIDKTVMCEEKGIRLIHIFEDEWRDKKEIVKSKIRRIIRHDTDCVRINARDCTVREIDYAVASAFLDGNHIQGSVSSTVYLGCFDKDGMLCGVMTFKKDGTDGSWDLNRFACKIDTLCRGFGGKMLSYFIKNYKPDVIKSFLDRRWGTADGDNLYNNIGFRLEGIDEPDYYYTDFINRRHKFGFRKGIMEKKYGFSKEMTESEMAHAAGWYRIWNCGLFKYVWRKETHDES